MKIEKIMIALLIIVFGVNFYSALQERERLNVGLNLLDKRISQAEDNINKANEYIGNTLTDFDNMEYILREDIDFVSSELARHKHEKIYIETKEEPKPVEKTEVPALEITPEPTNIDEAPSIERFYDPETELHVPSITTTPIKPVVAVFIDPRDPADPESNRRGEEFGTNSDYNDFFIKELMPKIESDYKISAKKNDTALLGTSLGGLNTTYLGFLNPDKFGKLAIQAPAYWYKEKEIFGLVRETDKADFDIFMSVGTINDNIPDT